jgi:phosphoribosylformimino-5-aminoimidazole carboxamide ribotide isomerase
VLVIPAIDLLDGRAVRLLRGSYDEVTVYDVDAVDAAKRWMGEGARRLHIVDLDAARGMDRDTVSIQRLVDLGIDIQVGGGIRSAAAAMATLEAGAASVVVGSALVVDSRSLAEIVGAVGPEKVIAAIDVRAGRAHGAGWQDAGAPVAEVLDRAIAAGITVALVTGIEQDGTMGGPDMDLLETVHRGAPGLGLIASGGVGSLDDLVALATSSIGIEAVIVGRALYEGRVDLTDAIAAVDPHPPALPPTAAARTDGSGSVLTPEARPRGRPM